MPLFEWDTAFALGLKELDEQNKLLMGLVKRFYADFRKTTPLPDLKCTLRVILVHARVQFDFEEQCMRETGYAQLEEHKKEHEQFIGMIFQLLRVTQEEIRHTLEISLRLNNLVHHHILKSDGSFTRYILSSQGESAKSFPCDPSLRLLVEKYLSH